MNFRTQDSLVIVALGLAALLALGTAWTAQYGFGLFPCELCLYQRLPYIGIVALSALALMPAVDANARRQACGLAALLFIATAGVAFFHIGVEQEWWQTNCAPTGPQSFSFEDIQAALQQPGEPACNEIAFELFGISMAGYNMLAGLVLAGLSGWAFRADRYWTGT